MLADLHSLLFSCDTLSRRYVRGTSVQFSREQERLALQIRSTEDIVALFNDTVAAPLAMALLRTEPPNTVDPAWVKGSRGPQVQVIRSGLVGFARA